MDYEKEYSDSKKLIEILQNTIIMLNNTISSLQDSLNSSNSTISSLQNTIEEQSATIAILKLTIDELTRKINDLSKEGKIRDKDISKLTSQIAKNSTNSSIPPSKDSIADKEKIRKEKKSKTKSLRSKSGKDHC